MRRVGEDRGQVARPAVPRIPSAIANAPRSAGCEGARNASRTLAAGSLRLPRHQASRGPKGASRIGRFVPAEQRLRGRGRGRLVPRRRHPPRGESGGKELVAAA